MLRKQIPSAVWGDTLRVNRRTGATVSIHDMSQLFMVQFNRFVPIDSIITRLEALIEVAYAHQPIQAVFHANPNDPKFQSGEQWNLTKINAAAAWDITKGSPNIVVGIIDADGVKRTHEDFTNADGTSQFVAGKGDNTFIGTTPHGTKVAGVVAAATDNNKGVASLGWNLKMIPYKWDFSEQNPLANLPAKIQQAIDDGVDIINMSFVTTELRIINCNGTQCQLWFSKSYISVQEKIQDAAAQGIVLVASAGNESLNSQAKPECKPCDQFPYKAYPAAYPEAIAVSATEQDDSFHNEYNNGNVEPEPFIDVAAPGIGILTTSGDGYATVNGTSFSAPLVAALPGLIWSVNPSLTRDQVKDIITATAVDIEAPGYDDSTGYGRINAHAAVLKTLDELGTRKSISALATAYNGSRKLVKNGSTYYLVYESGNQIYFTKSTDNGSTWSDPPARLSDGFMQNNFPCIAERSGNLYVVWQRKNGSTHDILYRSYASGAWSSIQALASGVGSNNPLPAMISSSLSSELMLVYRTSSALQYRRYTGGSWQSPASVTGTTSASRNPSLSYNEDFGFVLTWDNGSNVYHQCFSTSWSSPVPVSSASLPAFDHQYSSNAASENMDRHIAWQAFEAVTYQRQAIYYNRNLNSTNFTMFVSENDDYLRPTITGHTGGAASVVWHDTGSNSNIRKAYYNGSSWADGQTGTVIASNGADASLSITNPYGGTAKAVWRSAGTAPYTLTLGPSGGLGKSAANEIFVYNRRVLYSLDTTAVLALQMGGPQIISNGSTIVVPFPAVADDDSLIAAQLAEKLSLSNVLLPADADSVVFTVHHYSRDAGQLRQNLQHPLQVAFVLSPTTVGVTPITISLGSISPTGESRQATRVALPVQPWRSQTVNLHTIISNLDVSKSFGTLIHVYEAVQSGVSKSNGQLIARVTDDQPSLTLRVHPNPFNPSTQIRFSLSRTSTVSLRIYDANGRLVRKWSRERHQAGEHAIVWDGNDQQGLPVTSGMYFGELFLGTERRVAKMMLIR
ncbi:MAG: S8 family serine peptidase [candidate division KSB1 bacterium]|nr:S8 family serine peptidase [candidate division KSB1 bacterium]MDZ7302775.1 S8 family serine peptidase [candidate division KSB1 bacterium]MDZ7310060.1 S8 family serine peptidase [candidate division KSB1 bacterium]